MKINPLFARITRIVCLGTASAWLIWDLVAFHWGGYNPTISKIVGTWMRDYPQVVFGVGFILGHLFWPQYRSDLTSKKQEDV